jgi:hypothetical protein
MTNDPLDFTASDKLHDLLTEMQRELMGREWTEDTFERIDRAVEFRGQLWDAIAAYRDHWSR